MPSPYNRTRSYTVPILIAVNVLVFLAWHGYGPLKHRFMAENFLVSWQALEEGRYWTLVTNVFSHIEVWHLLVNMMVLKSFGTIMEMVMGRRNFLLFYFIAGIVSSFAHAAVSNFLLGQPELPALGASGALAGTVLLFALMFPREKLLFFFVIPLPALWAALAFIGLDLWGLSAQYHGGGLPIGHGAHLGGSFTGIVTYFLIYRGRMKRLAEKEKAANEISEDSTGAVGTEG